MDTTLKVVLAIAAVMSVVAVLLFLDAENTALRGAALPGSTGYRPASRDNLSGSRFSSILVSVAQILSPGSWFGRSSAPTPPPNVGSGGTAPASDDFGAGGGKDSFFSIFGFGKRSTTPSSGSGSAPASDSSRFLKF